MIPINKIIWTEKEIKFLKEKYIETTLTKEELRQLFNRKFHFKRTSNAIKRVLENNQIKKTEYYWRETSKKNVLEGIKRKSRKTKIFKLKVMKFMRKLSKEGLTSRIAFLESQTHFEVGMTMSYFRIVAREGNIKFVLPQTKEVINDLDPEMYKNKELEKYLKLEAKTEKGIYEVESDIIYKFKFRLSSRQIKKYCILKGIRTKWK